MANQWLFQTENSHKENDEKTKLEELFVFGYACKIFRDDAQAKMVDAGTYMIPWMGDDRLRIDRYDGRGHLYDLAEYDADRHKGQPPPELTEDEKRIETFCDEERYLELHTDVSEKTMYEEEEWKRYYESLSEGYKAVGFSYDYNGQPQAEEEAANEDPEDQVYVPAPELQVPTGVQVPPTVKHNNIVEKTAKFIAEHGIQMEILMKTKQSRNVQFNFMHFGDELYTYFRHVVTMIKSKKYAPKTPEKEKLAAEENEDDAHIYLHPALLTSNRASPTPEVDKPVVIPMPKVSIHETSYGQLLQSFSKVDKDVAARLKPKTDTPESRIDSPEPTMLPACMAQSGYGPTHGTVPLPPGIEPVTLPTNGDSGDDKHPPRKEIHVDESEVSHIVPPPPDLQPVIDRMAMYVARNGVEFEIVVKSKKDPRFQFLESWHDNFMYYDFKKNLFTQEIEKNKKVEKRDDKETEKDEEAEKAAAAASKGVKFKVKAKDTEQKSVVDQKQIFEYETSEEEDGGESSEGHKDKATKGDASRTTSRTATPVKDMEPKTEVPPEVRERKQAEQRMKDRLAQTARDKLTQVKKEEQLKADRKRKAALFINMLKTATPTVPVDDTPTSDQVPTPCPSGTNTPIPAETTSQRHKSSKSKHKHRSSRSRSRSPTPKKHKRGATPPSAYTVVRRSPLRRAPPPPPPRRDPRRERSPSGGQSSRHRSRSPSSRSKSKKKKRSRSPTSHDHRHKRSSKKKKKRSRSPHRKSSRREKSKSVDHSDTHSAPTTEGGQSDSVGVSGEAVTVELEEGERRDSSPEPGEIEMEVIDEIDEETDGASPSSVQKSPPKSPSRSRSPSISRTSRPQSRSRSTSKARSRSRSNSRSKSRSRSRSDSSDSVDRVHSRNSPVSPSARSRSRSPVNNISRSESVSRSGLSTPDRLANGGESNGSVQTEAAATDVPKKDVSKYMLGRVRAMIKASREAIIKEDREENIFDDP